MKVGDLVRLNRTNRVAVVLSVNLPVDGIKSVDIYWIKEGRKGRAYFKQLELINENQTKSR